MSNELSVDSFLDLVRRTNCDQPAPQDLDRLRDALEQQPSLLEEVGDFARQSQEALLANAMMNPGVRLLVRQALIQIREQLGYSGAPKLEQLLIEQICGCYLRHYLYEYNYHVRAGELTLESAERWERVISLAQRRYLRAIETLSRVRKLGVNIQVNIATQGGQQVNLGGPSHVEQRGE